MNIYNLTVIGSTLKYTFLYDSDTLYIDGITIYYLMQSIIHHMIHLHYNLQNLFFNLVQVGVEIHNANIHVAVEHLFYILDGIVTYSV